MAVTRDGVSVRCWTFPGKTADTAMIRTVTGDLAGWQLQWMTLVADRGFASAVNRARSTAVFCGATCGPCWMTTRGRPSRGPLSVAWRLLSVAPAPLVRSWGVPNVLAGSIRGVGEGPSPGCLRTVRARSARSWAWLSGPARHPWRSCAGTGRSTSPTPSGCRSVSRGGRPGPGIQRPTSWPTATPRGSRQAAALTPTPPASRRPPYRAPENTSRGPSDPLAV